MSEGDQLKFGPPADLFGALAPLAPVAPAGAAADGGAAGEGTPPPAGARGLAAMTDGPLRRLVDDNFIRYASYVIRDRAIPDLDDGLKPVQRRILWSLHKNDDGKLIKVANVVGYCMQFHPHGDASIGDALVVLANRLFLIERQGNFGNMLTGDPAAAARYIECRLTELARTELFHDDLTELVPTYDGRKEEPVSLPAKIPLLLMLGAEGIAVGISTRILPHNFSELIEAQIAILQKKSFQVFPDFPQGGLMDASGYDEGRGAVQVRARIETRDPQTLVVRELPFGVTTDALIASIEDAARKGKLRIRSINDFTAEKVEIEIVLQEGQDSERATGALYAFTSCQVQISSRPIVIRERHPVEMDVPQILRHNTERLVERLRKELQLEKRKLTDELHRKTLVQVFIGEKIYRLIEKCETADAVGQAVLDGLAPFRPQFVRDVTHADVEMLLGIPIRRISHFDLAKNRAEMEKIVLDTGQVERNLAGLTAHAVRYLRALLKKHGGDHPRRTELTSFGAIAVRELTATEWSVGYDREKGYLGHKVTGETLLRCSSYDKIVLVWKDGRIMVMPPPEKLFVDATVIYAAVVDRARVFTVVYSDDRLTYAKRFEAGGAIMNKEYRCIPKTAEIRVLADDRPPAIYVRYAPGESGKIRQQLFPTSKLPVRDRDARGVLMSSKRIEFVGAAKPPDWDDARNGPAGAFMSFL